jgi:protein gp37
MADDLRSDLHQQLAERGHRPLRHIQWAIVGGESGPRSRPMSEEWVGEIETVCRKERTAFFFKLRGFVRKKISGRHYRGRTFDEMPRGDRDALVPPFLRR